MHDPKEFIKREISSKVVTPASPNNALETHLTLHCLHISPQDLCKNQNQQNTKQFIKSSTLNYKNLAKKASSPEMECILLAISGLSPLQEEDLK